MQPFEYYQPTQVICEDGAAQRCGALARVLGGGALLVTGSASSRMNGALAAVRDSLEQAHVRVDLLEGVPGNPDVAIVDAGAKLMRSRALDVVVAVGGGSVIDAAKAIATSAATGRSYRTYLSGIRTELDVIEASLPVIAVPTLPGSGSETNGTSVVIDDVTGRKLSASSELAAPRVALLDPEYASTAPRELLATGIADALCHAVEAGLSQRASVASDAAAHSAIALLAQHGVAAAGADRDAMAHVLWASNLAGQALSLAGSIVTHPLAHPLSARCGAHHGATVAALEPVVIAAFAERWDDELGKVARWFGAKVADGAQPQAGARALLTRLAACNRQLGVTATAGDLGLSADLRDVFVADALASGSRGLANMPGAPLGADDLAALYDAAVSARPDVAPRTPRTPRAARA